MIAAFLAAVFFAAAPLAAENNSWALLELDAEWPDRYIGELLSQGKVNGSVSESSQWVFLNDFGELSRVPLDEFPDRLEDFDPRHDGYAERLSAFFVRGDTRRFFIPLPEAFSELSRVKLERSIAGSLGDIPYTLRFFGSSRSLWWYLVIFVIAAAVFITPALFIKRPQIKPLRRVKRKGGLRHARFVPVQILGGRPSAAPLAFPLALMLAVTLAVLSPLLASVIFPAPSQKVNWPGEVLVEAEEYARHAAFQISFPLRQLSGDMAGGGLNQTEYLRYYIGDDGLIAGAEDFAAPEYGLIAGSAEIPPFPLKDLMEFLAGKDDDEGSYDER
ncbi:hypothetical protein FACS1894147_12530 [Spirochaetia bacterium]|nr:hypothetical protein FACS1894147_12530 [Spirochaetia bacterium]